MIFKLVTPHRALREGRGRLTPPGFRDEDLEISDGHSVKAYKNCWKAIVMRFGEKLLRVG